MDKVTILGAGLAGLSCAYHLNREYEIYEKQSKIGGLCKSKKINGFTFDYDGHLLHFKKSYVKNLLYGLLNNKLVKHKRESLIYSHNTYTKYPFQAKLYGLPNSVIQECLEGLIKSKFVSAKNSNFKNWVLMNFGEGIAEHFMIPYNEKFWTVPLNELTADWVDGFIPVPDIKEILNGILQPDETEFGYNVNFWYPSQGGIENISKALGQRLNNLNISSKAEIVDLDKRQIYFNNKKKIHYNRLISTIPLPNLVDIIKPVGSKIKEASRNLKFTSVYVLNFGIKKKIFPGVHWIYFPSKEYPFYRIGFPHNFSSELVPSGCSSVYVEFSYSKNRLLDKNKIENKTIEKLKQLSIIDSEKEIIEILPMDIKYGYVLYDKDYSKARDTIISFLKNNGINTLGRYGNWEYKSMEDVILDGKKMAEELNN